MLIPKTCALHVHFGFASHLVMSPEFWEESVAILPKKAFFHEFSEMGLSSLWRVHCTIFHRLILEYASFLAEGMRTIMSNRQNEQNCSSMRFQAH